MAIYSNQATLTVGGTSVSSNVAYGEILDVLTVTKTAVEGTYGTDGCPRRIGDFGGRISCRFPGI